MGGPRVRTIDWVDACGVPPLTLVEREAGVATYREDILAVTDDGMPVVDFRYGLRAGVRQLPATAGQVPASSQGTTVPSNGRTPVGSRRDAATDVHAGWPAARRPAGRRPLPAQEP